jgi:hypothetical protein
VVRAFGHSRETANHEQNAKLEHCQFVIRQPAPLGGVPGRECLYHGLATLPSHWGRSRDTENQGYRRMWQRLGIEPALTPPLPGVE